jgi:hypothetical protein
VQDNAFDKKFRHRYLLGGIWLFNGINFDKSRTTDLDSLAVGIFILIKAAITDSVFTRNFFITLLGFFIGVIL